MELEALYNSLETPPHPYCQDCSIRSVKKPCHAIKDYEGIGQVDVLFLVDSLVWDGFSVTNFNSHEEGLFDRYVKPILKEVKWTVLASVKCPDVKQSDMKPKDRESCRNFLRETILETKPKLIMTCGALPLEMLLKERGIKDKRGSTYWYEEIPVIPLFHPMSVVLEPRHLTLFQQDIFNAVNKYIHKDTTPPLIKWEVVNEIEKLKKYDFLATTSDLVSIDIETTGLDFLRKKITTVGISYKVNGELNQIIIPVFHKETNPDPNWVPTVIEYLKRVCKNPRNKKILQNSKFDAKFLLGLGIEVVNIEDTKDYSHLVNEELPKGLRDLVIRYFPQEVEEL